MKRERIILIDGSGYFFRAFYAIQRLSTSKGFPTNAIFGFINMLLRVLDVEKPTKLAIVFDTPKPTFRKERYKEYKANREAPPDDLVKQVPHILRSVDCFGIKRMECPGFEADDVIATIAEKAAKEGYQTEIITGDKDLMQLVTDHVTLYDTMKDKRVDANGVKERFGVMPDQIVDLLALMGDSSDNIPGVTGIGEKTAAELIQKFGSVDGIYERIEEITQPKRRETLLKEKEMAYLSRELATAVRNVPCEFEWDDFNYKGPINDKLQAFLEEFEFQNLMKRFNFKPAAEKSFTKGRYQTVSTADQLRKVVEELSACPVVAVDTETTSLVCHEANVVGVSLSGKETEAYYIPLQHTVSGERAAGQIEYEEAKAILKPFLEDPAVAKIGQNVKYDAQVLRCWGIDMKGLASDTMVASYLIDPDQSHGLDAMAFRLLGHQNISYEEVTGKGKSQVSFAEVPIDKATEYSGEDADVTLRLYKKLLPDVEERNLTRLYREVELPLVEVLADMEYNGIAVDAARLKKMSVGLENELATVQDKIFSLAGGPININSPKQLSALLFEKLKLPAVKKTKTGYSTDESVLEKLASEHEICRWIISFREFGKLKSTYVEGLLSQIQKKTGRIHTTFNQTVAATGRLSSTNPNLQNIPASGDPNYDIRTVFVAAPGAELLSADYSQVELRLLADMSGDEALIEAFQKDEDVHNVTARYIFGLKEKAEVTSEQRKVAKTVNFGVIYGQTPYGLSQQLEITTSDAKEFIERYFARFPKVRDFLRGLAEGARKRGYAVTMLGRRRYLPDLDNKNRMIREMAERAAINAPIQGTAADMIKLAMVRLHRSLKQGAYESKLVLQVHDELVLEVRDREREKIESLVRKSMETALDLRVPLKVDLGWGRNWAECS